MAENADSVVVALVARVDNFDGKVRQSATAFDAGMSRIETSANKAEAAVGTAMTRVGRSFQNAAQRSRNLGFQISDIGTQLSSGTSPFIVLAQQGPQVANALDGARGAVGRFASFLSGPWGAALLAATTILGGFLLKNRESGESVDDLVDKLKEQARKAQDSEKANDLFAKSIEGVTKAANDAEDAVDKLRLAKKGEAEQTAESIRKNLDEAEALRNTTRARLADARALLEAQQARATAPGTRSEIAALGLAGRLKDIERIEGELRKADAQAERLRQSLNRAVSFQTVERETASAEDKINRRYDAMIDKAALAADASAKAQAALRKEIQAIDAAREAELKRLRDTERERRTSDQQAGRQITEAQARSIVAGIGGTVTSGTRTPQHNAAVGGAQGSFHLKGQALDIAKTAGLTLGKIVAAFEKQGVQLIEKLDEGDHFHIAWSRRGGGRRGPSDETLAKRAMAAADAELNRRRAYENELASMQGEELDARQALITAAEEIAKIELMAIEVSRQKYNNNLDALVAEHKLTEGRKGLGEKEAEELRKINDERAKLRAELVHRREAERKFRMQEEANQRAADLQQAQLDSQVDLLRSQEQLATTAAERHAIERRLIDLQFEEERLRNQYIIAWAERVKTNQNASDKEKADAALAAQMAQLRLDTIPQRQANAQAGNNRNNAGPLSDFFGRIPDTAGEINEALESVAAGGLATFTDALTQAIVQWDNFGQAGLAALQAVTAELVKLAIQQIIVNTIGKAFGKDQKDGAQAAVAATQQLAIELASIAAQQVATQAIQASLGAATTAATAAQAALVAAAWAPAAAAASLATLGGNAAPAAAALVATNALASALALPKGFELGGFTGGRRGKVAGLVHGEEFVFNAGATRRIGRPMLEALHSGRITPSNAVAARPGAIGGGLDLSRLESIVDRAAHAMPTVNLYPTLDAAEVQSRGLNSQMGTKNMKAWIAANRQSIKGILSGA